MIEYFIIDVDGTMTDGSIYYGDSGLEVKKFNTKDAAGFFAASALGVKTMVLTGRECEATTRRLEDLHVDYVFQGIREKKSFIERFFAENSIDPGTVCYIGDDLNDLAPMKLCGYKACPEDACEEIRAISDYISCQKGGYGAVRDVIEHILREEGLWDKATSVAYSGV